MLANASSAIVTSTVTESPKQPFASSSTTDKTCGPPGVELQSTNI